MTYATIPPHTPLFHARRDANEPESPEWLAFDPQMSLGIMFGGYWQSFLRIYSNPKQLGPLLYLDGMSAALTNSGTLDLQDILIYGSVQKSGQWDEYGRAKQLCAWGVTAGVKGFVRTNAGFELLWCNFTEGISLTNHLNTTDWWQEIYGEPVAAPPWGFPRRPGGSPTARVAPEREPPAGPPTMRPHWPCNDTATCRPPTHGGGRSPFADITAWEWLRSATEVYSGNGEARIHLDSGRLVTAYGRDSLPFESQDMSQHRLQNMTTEEARRFKADVLDILSDIRTSGVDWRGLSDTIATRYGRRLPEIHKFLSNGTRPAVNKARLVVSGLLMPFSRLNATFPENLHLCTHGFTSLITFADVNRHELELWRAILEVNSAICTFLLNFHTTFRILPPINKPASPIPSSDLKNPPDPQQWADRLRELMDRLDWKMWVKCEEECAWDQICYLPIWPIGRRIFRWPGQGGGDGDNNETYPRCVDMDWYYS